MSLLWSMIPIHEDADSRRTLPTFPGRAIYVGVSSTEYGGGAGPANSPVAQHSRPAPADATALPCVGCPGLTFRCGATNSGATTPMDTGRWALYQMVAVTGRLG